MRNHLFIVTYGRTGSTLLLGILNAHPKIRIQGENAGLFHGLYESLRKLDQFENHRDTMACDTPENPYFGATAFPFSKVREEITRLLDGFFPEDDAIETTGFKEIRYDSPDLDNFLDFLKSRYANTRFVFLTREHAAVVRSGFYKNTDPEILGKHLSLIEARFRNYAARNPAISLQLDYRDLLSFDRIPELFSFLGYSASEESWKSVISTKHSYTQSSVTGITPGSSLVIFDSSRTLLETSSFECSNHELKNMSRLALSGVLVPKPASGSLQSLVFKNATHEYPAKIGIASPGFAKKFPDNPLAAHGRFNFAKSALSLTDGLQDLDLVATFSQAGTQPIGRLFVAGSKP